jgi:cytochrome P450
VREPDIRWVKGGTGIPRTGITGTAIPGDGNPPTGNPERGLSEARTAGDRTAGRKTGGGRTAGIRTAGPSFLPRLLRGDVFRENAAEFLLSNAKTYGDLVTFKALGRTVLQFNHPELVQEMLVRDAQYHHRNLVMQRSKAVLGEGLLTSEEPLHMRQRRLAQPAFHRQRIAVYGEVIALQTERMTEGWPSGATMDVRGEMLLLALRIVGKTLFDTDVEQDVDKISAAVDSFQGFLPLAFLPFSSTLQRLPVPAMRRIRRGREELDALIYRMIAERRADPADRGDLLSMLLTSQEVEDGGTVARMSDVQVRDECLTVLLAGHETTANALSFALWLLAENEGVQEELAAECRRVLGGRTPAAADYAQLGLGERVFAEALRLYPPVWVTARTAAESYMYRGMQITKGTILIAPQFAVHRDPRWWDEPEVFDPGRFTAEAKAGRPKMAYFPFGAGGRQCIGEGLAWMEGTLALAAMMQSWRVARGEDGSGEIRIDPSVSLRPKGAVRLRVERR